MNKTKTRIGMCGKTAAFFILAAAAAVGCGRRRLAEYKAERSEKLYAAAMADYSAGRLEAAEKGFLAAVRGNPANASARFQLACLKQDRAHDYAGAIHHFDEYILLDPDGDKVPLAKERIAICREAVKKALADDSHAGGALAAELEKTKALLAEQSAAAAKLSAENAALSKRASVAEDENTRLRKMISLVGTEVDDENSGGADVREMMRELGTRAEAEDDDDAGGGRIIVPQTVADLITADDAQVSSKVELPAGKARKAPASAEKEKKPVVERPEKYVVQDGDTLYRIAIKYYGRVSAWRAIRDANKALITTDGRVKAGDEIVLPDVK